MSHVAAQKGLCRAPARLSDSLNLCYADFEMAQFAASGHQERRPYFGHAFFTSQEKSPDQAPDRRLYLCSPPSNQGSSIVWGAAVVERFNVALGSRAATGKAAPLRQPR
jgi:hypothetical protein